MWLQKIVVIFIFLSPFLGLGQKPYQLVFTNNSFEKIKKNPEKNFRDSLSTVQYAQKLKFTAIEKGYLTASIDTSFFQGKSLHVTFYLGQKFEKMRLNLSPSDLAFFRKHIRVSEKFLTNQQFRPREIAQLLTDLHTCLVSNGYPFAKIELKNVNLNDQDASADIVVKRYNLLNWSKIIVKGDTAVSLNFMYSLLQIKPGKVYDESQVRFVTERINQVSFLSEIKPSELLFTPEGVELYLYIESNPRSSINGFLGLQPDPAQDRYTITGELQLKLLNVLKKGELLDLNWRNIQAQTQQLQLRTNFPFLFKSPFGMDGQFNLYKRDSTFLELKTRLAIQYYLKGGNYVSFFFERNNSSLLGGAANTTSFSNLANVSTNNYGATISRRNVDYLPNPSRGLEIVTSMSVGQRTSQISDTSLEIKNLVVRAQLNFAYYIPIAKRQVIRLANQTNLVSTETIFQNELVRFGGLLNLRGFNEDEIFGSTVSIFSLEYRFLLDRNSRLFLFYDQGIYENTSLAYRRDQPFGLGAGLSFGTAIGIFSLQYAIGSQQNNPILIRNGKIHFGYIAYF